MKLGNASWGFRETPLEKQLEITKGMGLTVLELGIANAPKDVPLDADRETLDAVKRLYDQYGVELLCAATGNDFSCGSRADVEKVKGVIDICAYLGVRILRVFAGFSPAAEVTGARWDTMIGCLKECGAYAEQKQVTLTVETHGGVIGFEDGVEHVHSTSTKPELLERMLAELPESIKVNYDPANLRAVGEMDPNGRYQMIKDRVAAVHLKDFVRLPGGHLKPAACGDGDMDWKAIVQGLCGFEGPMLFEYELVEDVEEGLGRCFRYIRMIVEE